MNNFNLQEIYTGFVRTAVPFLVGGFVTLLTTAGIELAPEAQADITALLTLALGMAYYVVVRLLAVKFPKLEWLLGSPVKPEYKR